MIGWTLTALILLAITGWETLAVYYSNLPEPFRLPGAIVIALVSLGILLMIRPAGRAILFFFVRFCNRYSLVPADSGFHGEGRALP